MRIHRILLCGDKSIIDIYCGTVLLQSSDSQPQGSDGLSQQQSCSTITAAQLAAALASATGEIACPLCKEQSEWHSSA
jgi:hypothetical protein